MLQANDPLARRVGDFLAARRATLAVVETSAGGLLSARLLSVPGASAWFERGVVAYGTRSKQALTGVSEESLGLWGAVSRETAAAMAEGIRRLAGVDYGVAETGIAGPQTRRRSVKPAGTAVIAVATPSQTVVEERRFDGPRTAVMAQIAERCLALLAELLATEPTAATEGSASR